MPKKILYVSPIWTNLKNYKLSDEIESGMPAFSEPLKLLLSNKVVINILWIRDQSSPSLVDKFFNSQSEVMIKTGTKIRTISSIIYILVATFNQIRKINPDIVFCQGALSVSGIIAAKLLRKKIVVRVYGTNKYRDELHRLGKLRFMIKYPLVFMSFFISSDILIATDDGSKSNEIFDSIGRSKEFHFLRNGYPGNIPITLKRKPYILCVGRIEKKKNQIGAVNFFQEAIKFNKDLTLKIIGETSSVIYFQELKKFIDVSNCKDKIDIIGGITKEQLFNLYQKSDAILSFQQNSNFGNVVIEALSSGTILFTYPENIFEEINMSHEEDIIFSNTSEKELARTYVNLSQQQKDRIRKHSRSALKNIIPSWENRSLKEMSIILKLKNV